MLYVLLLLPGVAFSYPMDFRDGLFWFICCFQHPTQPSTIVLQQTFHPPPNQVSLAPDSLFHLLGFSSLYLSSKREKFLTTECSNWEKMMCFYFIFFRTIPSNSSRSYLPINSSHRPTTPTTEQLFIPNTYQQQPPPYNTNY
jgi:hypothetical protein